MSKKSIYLTSVVLVLALAGTNVVFGDITIERRISAGSDDAEEAVNPGYQDCYNTSTDLEILDDHADNGGRQFIGMNFRDITIPPGANISNAYIEFVCDETKDGTAEAYLLIWGHLTPDPDGFKTPFVISNRPRTKAQVPWEPEPWSQVEQKIRTSDISSIIQELIEQSGWVSGNAVEIIVGEDTSKPPFTGSRCAVSYNGVPSQAPLLHIEWTRKQKYAKGPNPADGQTDVSRDVVLSWKSGDFVAPVNGHKVYFSENFNDVKDGMGSIIQDTNSYDPGRLDFSKTYYWRIDEVNGAPDFTVYEGNVWQFTTESVAYAIENVTATASSQSANRGPENTINGSGLDEIGLLHNKEGDDNMWLSDIAGPQPTWIQFEFDKVYRLHELWVWNANDSLELMLGFGFKDVTIEYSANGTDYTTLGTTAEFAQAPGMPDYAHNTTIDMAGLPAKYVRLTANSNWGGILPQYGLSEVRFFHIPVRARKPNPDSGATDVEVGVTLGWRAGREAAKHDVYLSTDEQAVINGTAPVNTVTEARYGPLSLDLGVTHYWRVDEVNEAEAPTMWQGELWEFATQEYIVVDDFESYNNIDTSEPESNRIFNVWLDGYGIATNGSLVGYEIPPFCELTIVHGGTQSMPLAYSNTGGAAYSEAERTFAAAQNWTQAGAATLVLYFHGTEGNTGQLYVKVDGSKVVYGGDAGDIAKAEWTQWSIDLASLSVNLQNIMKLAIGIDGNGASGTLYVDDIGLYVLAPDPQAN